MISPYASSGDNVLDSVSLIQQLLWFQSSILSNHQGGGKRFYFYRTCFLSSGRRYLRWLCAPYWDRWHWLWGNAWLVSALKQLSTALFAGWGADCVPSNQDHQLLYERLWFKIRSSFKRCLRRRCLRSWGHAHNFLSSVQLGVDKLLICTLCQSLKIWKMYFLYSWTAIRTWHPDSPPLEEAPTCSWWPLTSHQGKEILTVKCFQSRGAGAWSLLQSYQKDLHPSAYRDGTCTLPIICTWTVFHSWPYRGKVIHYVILQVQLGPSLTSVLSGAQISASDVRDPGEPTCWDLIWKVFSLIIWLRNWSQVLKQCSLEEFWS